MPTGGLILGVGDFGVVDLINDATQDATADAQAFADEANAAVQSVGNVVNRELQILPAKAGQAMNIGTPVYISGADGTNIIVSPASNASEATSSKVLGLLMQTLANNGQGSVVTQGKLVGLNTSTATLGNPVWLGVSGALIYGLANKPVAPAHLVYLGVVSRVHVNLGEIIVHVQNGFEMNEIHDFKVLNPIKNDVPTYNPTTQLWENKQPLIVEQFNPDIAFAIIDAQRKMFAWFDMMGKMYADIQLYANSVTTETIENLSITKEKLEQSLQDLLTLLGNYKRFEFNSDFDEYAYAILDEAKKIMFGIRPNGKLNFPTIEEFLFDPEFHEFIYVYKDAEGKILFGIRPDGTISTPFTLGENAVGLNELKQEVLDLIEVEKTIVFWGDSLTFGWGGNGTSTPSVMQDLKPDYTVINCGVGGETVASISARQGGMPCLVTAGFMIPANTSTVEISSNSNKRLKNVFGTNIDPLLQGENGDSINPCWIEGVECTLSWNGSSYFLQRNVAGGARYVKPNSPLFFKGAKAYRDANIVVIEIGQNGGYSTTDEYLEYVESMIRYSRTSNFIVVGNHTGTPLSRAELETACLRKFGSRYINMREYISGNAIYDMNITPTQQDLTAIQNGTFPPSFWLSPQDSVHGNALFYTAKAYKINERFIELGY